MTVKPVGPPFSPGPTERSSSAGPAVVAKRLAIVAVAVIAAWPMLVAAQMAMAIVSVLSTLVTGEPIRGLINAIFLGGISGLFSGSAIALLRSLVPRWREWRRQAREAVEHATDEAFDERLAEGINASWWFHVLFAAGIGLVTGAIGAAGGVSGLFQFLDGSGSALLTNHAYPMATLLGGGFGGPGGDNGWALVFFVVVIVLLLLVFALAATVAAHILVLLAAGVAGMVREGAKEKVLHMVKAEPLRREAGPSRGEKERAPLTVSLVRGLGAGIVTALVHGLITGWEARVAEAKPPRDESLDPSAPASTVPTAPASEFKRHSDDWTLSLNSATCTDPCCAGSACVNGRWRDCASGFTCVPGDCGKGFDPGQPWNLILSAVIQEGGVSACDSELRSASVCFANAEQPTCVPIADPCEHRGRATVTVAITTEDLIARPMEIVIRRGEDVVARRSGILYPRGLLRSALCVGARLRGFEASADQTPVERIKFFLEPRRTP